MVQTAAAHNAAISKVQEIARDLGLMGRVDFFGSYANGLKTASSDCDIVYIAKEEDRTHGNESPVMILQRFAQSLQQRGFHSVVTVFQAAVPLLKAVDPAGTDIDLCVGNLLGYHNSRLLGAYCRLDDRVANLGQLVKQWASYNELIGSSDGHLNSYAYSLLTIFYLMNTTPPVVPNLQALSDKVPPRVPDHRWGTERMWECGFWEEVDLIPKTNNRQSTEELLRGFFDFYLGIDGAFDWTSHAASIRLARTSPRASEGGGHEMPDKYSLQTLHTRVARDQWYLEDPFDLGHNLAANCTPAGKRRILNAMRHVRDAMAATEGGELAILHQLCPKIGTEQWEHSTDSRTYFLKCRVHPKKVRPDEFAEAFKDYTVSALHFPRGSWRHEDRPEAFIEFRTDADRKQAHTINETYVNGWQLRLFTTCRHALEDSHALGISFERMDGWMGDSSASPRTTGRGGWRVDRRRGEKNGGGRNGRGMDPTEMQRERVQDGIRQAEGLDELDVLRQRAVALGLKDAVMNAGRKIDEIRGTRGGSYPGGPPPAPPIPPPPPAAPRHRANSDGLESPRQGRSPRGPPTRPGGSEGPPGPPAPVQFQ